MHSFREEHGQVMVISTFLLAVLMMLTGVIYHLGEAVVTKMRLVNAIDAGAQAGGALLATSLNIIGVLNAVRLILAIHRPWFIFDKTIPKIQGEIARIAPYLAMTTAVETAIQNGADFALPMNFLGGCPQPDLEVRSGFLGWMQDKITKNSRFPYGKRFIILGGVKRRRSTWFLNGLRKLVKKDADDGGVVFALSESAVHGESLSSTYKASLVKLHPGGVQLAIDRLKSEYQKKFGRQKDERTDQEKEKKQEKPRKEAMGSHEVGVFPRTGFS